MKQQDVDCGTFQYSVEEAEFQWERQSFLEKVHEF